MIDMGKGEAIVSFIKLATASVAAGAASTPAMELFTSYVNLPVWGVPVSVIGAAAFGAGLSLFFGDPIPSRRALYGQTLAATVFGAAWAVLVADGMNWEWAQKNIGMFALSSAAVVRWFLPTMIERGKQLIKEFRFPSIKKTDGDDK
jgi:hypothetical protein